MTPPVLAGALTGVGSFGVRRQSPSTSVRLESTKALSFPCKLATEALYFIFLCGDCTMRVRHLHQHLAREGILISERLDSLAGARIGIDGRTLTEVPILTVPHGERPSPVPEQHFDDDAGCARWTPHTSPEGRKEFFFVLGSSGAPKSHRRGRPGSRRLYILPYLARCAPCPAANLPGAAFCGAI